MLRQRTSRSKLTPFISVTSSRNFAGLLRGGMAIFDDLNGLRELWRASASKKGREAEDKHRRMNEKSRQTRAMDSRSETSSSRSNSAASYIPPQRNPANQGYVWRARAPAKVLPPNDILKAKLIHGERQPPSFLSVHSLDNNGDGPWRGS